MKALAHLTKPSEFDFWALAIGAALGLLTWLSSWPWIIQAVFILMAMDVLTGLIAGGRNGKLDSSVSRRGMAKKVMQGLLVGMAHYVGHNPAAPLPLGEMAAGAFFVTEGLSIVENAERMGINVNWLRPYFERLATKDKPP